MWEYIKSLFYKKAVVNLQIEPPEPEPENEVTEHELVGQKFVFQNQEYMALQKFLTPKGLMVLAIYSSVEMAVGKPVVINAALIERYLDEPDFKIQEKALESEVVAENQNGSIA